MDNDGWFQKIVDRYIDTRKGGKMKGNRVMAILNADDTFVNVLGYGEYLGEEIHPEYQFKTPKIVLDNGDIVWGCECWWGNVEEMEKRFFDGKREVRNVKIEDYRNLPWSE